MMTAHEEAMAAAFERQRKTIAALCEALQQFVNGVETHMIDSPADDILANVTSRAKAALEQAKQ